MSIIEQVWWLLVLIGVMILVHELGHFWAARWFDVKVEAFSFGFGPRLFGFKRGETDFRFSLILFGGYVKMAGEQIGDEGTNDPRSFLAKPRWQRLIIAFAGPFMNIVLAVVLVTGLFTQRFPQPPLPNTPVVGYVSPDGVAAKAGVREGDRILTFGTIQNPTWEDIRLKEIASPALSIPVVVEHLDKTVDTLVVTPILDDKEGVGSAGWYPELPVHIASVEKGMAAEQAGLQAGDVLHKLGGQPVRFTQKLYDVVGASQGKPIEVVVLRDGKEITTTLKANYTTLDGRTGWFIGLKPGLPPITYTALPIGQAFQESIKQNVKNAGLIFDFLRGIVERRMSPKSLEGPIRIAKISTEAAREGPFTFISLMAVVSLNLAIFNLLPIPILDGGVILMLLIEMVMRREMNVNFKEAMLKVGFVFLMMLVAFVLYNDISKS